MSARIGRCSRAGRSGKATNFYDDRALELLKRIRDSENYGQQREAAAADGNHGTRELEFEEKTDEVFELDNRGRGRGGSKQAVVREADPSTLAAAFSRRRGIRRHAKRVEKLRQEQSQQPESFDQE
jgi:superfamily II DNA/RNA helicase